MRSSSRPEGNGEFIFVSMDSLAGWVRRDALEELKDFIRDPDRSFAAAQVLKHEPKIKIIRRSLAGGRDVIIKRFHYGSLWRRTGFLFLSSPAFRCVKGAALLIAHGIETALPLAAFEHRDWERRGTSYYVAEEVKGSHDLPRFWREVLPAFSADKSREIRRKVLQEVAFLLHRLHSQGIYHRDVKGGNILIRLQDHEEPECFLIDVDRVSKRRHLSWTRRFKNLAQLYRTLGGWVSVKERLFFLKRYGDLCSLSAEDRKALAHRLLRTPKPIMKFATLLKHRYFGCL